MKRILFWIIFCVIFTSLSAQKLQYNPFIGVNANKLNGVSGYDRGIGYQIGVDILHSTFEDMGFCSGISFVNKRSSNELKIADENGEVVDEVKATLEFNYLRIPFAAYVKISEGVKLIAGPHLEIKLGDKQTVEENDYISNEDFKIADEDLNPLDFGLHAGVKCDFEKINLSFLYNRNFASVFSSGMDLKFQDGLTVTVGYLLN